MEYKNSLTESLESSPSPPSPPPNSSPGGAVKHLVGLPSRGLFFSTILSSNLGEMRVYVCDHDTAPPEEQVIKTNGMNIFIKALQINKEKKKKGKRSVTRTLESRSPAKRANIGGSLSTSRQGSSNTPSEKILQVMTVE
ncbi:DET1- and DDB1-associated protein 1 N-terminal [Dioscorea alata]|uniref:DET1- and DDB1-associated protein 1 N-terminal n=1 Tax=Dioscorea alata TaxID=55571 RepID=A0ACB7VS85_DIOAL|nr:DET1- and DDB1-associated protein 1 N-terminal [Dioscorea alata]